MPIQNLFQRSSRTFLTLGVIGITVGAIMALEGMVQGFAVSMTEAYSSSKIEIMIRQADVSDTSLSVIDKKIGDKIAALPEVKSASGVIFTAIAMPEAGGFFILMGYAPNEYAIQRYKIIDGSPLTGNHQVIVGKGIAETLNVGVGDTLDLSGSRFKIQGIYESSAAWEEMGGVISLRDAQTLTGRPRKSTMYAIKLHDPDDAETIVERINTQFPEIHASLTGDFVDQMPDMENSDAMISGISFLAILVGGVGVLNTMLMSVFERTREIGVLRALGWRSIMVLSLIIREALILGLLGGFAGIAIALALTSLLKLAPALFGALEPIWDVNIFVRAILIAVFLGLLGGIFPAYRATRLQPVEALRYE
jgi:ABC-type lipoprotein release transport system permease subunit